MSDFSHRVYRFNDFQFDKDRLALYHRDVLIKDVDKKSLQVLAALLQNPNEVVSHEEIIEAVWGENPHGATPARINQYASRLQKVLVKYEPEIRFLENLRGRGYVFRSNVSETDLATNDTRDKGQENGVYVETERLGECDKGVPIDRSHHPVGIVDNETNSLGGKSQADNAFESALSPRAVLPLIKRPSFRNTYWYFGSVVVVVLALAVTGWWRASSRSEEEVVRRVVKDSQMFESMVLYKNPTAFKEEDLDRYWTNELDLTSNDDRRRIRDLVKKLVEDQRRYGDETRCEQFDFQSVEINSTGDVAVVKTLEKWFVAVYGADNELLKNRTIGPYFVSYILKKTDGRWLVEKSTTARVNRPTPRLVSIEPTSEIVPGRQSMFRITGEDMEPETVYLEVVGPGCPEAKPCRVPNSALRETAKLSATELTDVPVTLASGEFRVTMHNGDSQASNEITIVIGR